MHVYPLVSNVCISIAIFSLIPGYAFADGGFGEDEQPWERCALCHALDGNSHMAKFPKLAGQQQGYLEKQIHAFRDGGRTNDGGQMVSIVTEIRSEDIRPIAAWFARQRHPEPIDYGASMDEGREIFNASGCQACHALAATVSNVVPLLKAQHRDYLTKQILDFQQGQRLHTSISSTSDPIALLRRTEVEAIASYLAGSSR